MNVVRLEAPRAGRHEVELRWSVTPATPLYRANSAVLRFPFDISHVPQAVWWRVALTCLHVHWPLLRPCKVVLPVRLAPGEREFWSRLCDAEAVTLDAQAGRRPAPRAVDIVESGPPVDPMPGPGDEGVVGACFSGGRDSLTQTAMLQELGVQPILVMTTSPREGSFEHQAQRRRVVMDEIVARSGLELVEVESDLRSVVFNSFPAESGVSVSELADCLLYFAAALAVTVARGGHRVFLASEAEVQESARLHGAIVQHQHCMYAAMTQRALSAVTRVRYGGLTAPLYQFQVGRLLGVRYPEVRDLQYSCWELGPDEANCSRCTACLFNALNLLAEGIAPREIQIDLATLLQAQADWSPAPHRMRRGPVAQRPARRYVGDHARRTLLAVEPAYVAALLEADGVTEAEPALRAFARLQETARAVPPPPEPGYRSGYLELVDAPLREGVGAIYDEHFERAPRSDYGEHLERTLTLSDWIRAPIHDPSLDRRLGAAEAPPSRSPVARPPSPAPLTDAELAPVRKLIPDREPEPVEADGRPVLRVAETTLDGNELAYLTECVRSNHVSSTGTFARRFEAAFAEACGCEHAVICSSGATALHLMLAATGIGAGDEVIVPAFTMIATANAVGYVGATPVFVDSDPETWNLDLARVPAALSEHTRALCVVHTYGLPVDADAAGDLAARNGLALLEDGAEAHGARWRGRLVGSLGRAAAFSFYGNKILTTGEGGAVTTDDPEIAAIARELRDHGFSSERHFWHRFRAFNYRMSNLQAAVGLAQVERLDELVEARRANAALYRDRLAGIDGLTLPPEVEGAQSVHWMFGILVEPGFGCSRDELRRRLAADGIETRTFFVPLHLQPSYIRSQRGARHPVAERLGATGLYLPSAPTLTEADIDRVAGALRRAQDAGRSPSSV